tara:strand:- start:1150 stop:1506 length:357 start_codon:yes stop_codon:yes gene_type:complete
MFSPKIKHRKSIDNLALYESSISTDLEKGSYIIEFKQLKIGNDYHKKNKGDIKYSIESDGKYIYLIKNLLNNNEIIHFISIKKKLFKSNEITVTICDTNHSTKNQLLYNQNWSYYLVK